MHIRLGQPFPLGATWDGAGTNFALFSEHATGIELCLFDPSGTLETHRIALRARDLGVWHIYLEGVGPGQLYGYRAHGPYAPAQGHRFNPHKLLLDPYAKALSGPVSCHELLWTIRTPVPPGGEHATKPPPLDTVDTAACLPKSVVIDPHFDWHDDKPLRTPWRATVIYECHVKGATFRHPEIPEALRGTYLGLAHPAFVSHLQSLGVTAVELLPVHQSMSELALVRRGLSNYWGYNTAAFFAPDVRYSCGSGPAAVVEFKTMVRALHAAGIEVLLDVVYNHTAEGADDGPTFCFRGLDNAAYYHLDPHDRARYRDFTGCGNSVNLHHPRVLQLVADSLRYWVADMHVDGFRFDLATELAREPNEFHRHARLFTVLGQDPVLAGAKLIAEPWDLGSGGYQLGSFPGGWAEWNDRFRDCLRRFWRGDTGQAPELASRLTGSSDFFGGRSPQASVNYVISHDGFTLHDLVSYSVKHNEANGEANRDGFDHNFSANWGVEGETDDRTVRARRVTVARSLLASTLLAQGVPMLSGGDEIGRTQHGNNNAYCQDNELSWYDWNLDDGRRTFLAFVRETLALRHELPALRRTSFFTGRAPATGLSADVTWIASTGQEMTAAGWSDPELRTIGMLLSATAADGTDERGQPLIGDIVLIWLNAEDVDVECHVPPQLGERFVERLNTAGAARGLITGRRVAVPAHALVVLVQAEP